MTLPTLFDYQKKDVIRIEDFDGRLLNANEMGLGKTLETLVALKRNPEWLPALIVCPSSVKFNWEHEAFKYVDFKSAICEGERPPLYNRNEFSVPTPLTIINYDILRHWLPYLKCVGFKTVVFDECHYLVNPTRKRTKAALEISSWVEHVLCLSGTPLTNRPSEMWPVLHMLWPSEFPAFLPYARRYCDPKFSQWGKRWDYSGSSNLDELHDKLKSLGMIRRRKADVLKDLPDMLRCIVNTPLSNEDEYKLAASNFIEWLKSKDMEKAKKAEKAEGLTKIGYLLRLTARLKLKSIVDWINGFFKETDEKFVLFAHHTQAIDAFKRRIDAKKVVVDGSVVGRARFAAVEQFQHDPETRLFIGSDAARVGLTLTAASNVGFAEFWWRPGDHTQAEARIHRIGQKGTSRVHYFVAPHTIEVKVCKVLQEKQKAISSVLDGGSNTDDLDIYESLMDELKSSKGFNLEGL